VNGERKVRVDVRIVSSTARNLERLIEEKAFRADLYHRLAVIPIRVPSLAERREDIPELVTHFIEQYSRSSGHPVKRLSEDALTVLQARDWPGNVRQLRNYVERLMILYGDEAIEEIGPDMLPPEEATGQSADGDGNGLDLERMLTMPLKQAREEFERRYLQAQLARFAGNISRTSAAIGMERSALYRKLKGLGLL
jgi:two-component system nitrogen regulation response regulator NtrX